MKFEDLLAWRKARELANAAYDLGRQKPLATDFGLRDQIQRAAVSAMSNLAEGFDRQHQKEKLQFYNAAKASAGEVKSLCYLILDQNLAAKPDAEKVRDLSSQTSALIQGLMRSTRERD